MELRALERLLGSMEIPTVFVPNLREATHARAATPGLVVLTEERLEVARVHIAPRGRSYMVGFLMGPGGDGPRLMTARTAEQAASTIAAYRGSGPLAGTWAEHGGTDDAR
ncbi:hypothetical protein [Herbidospora sp. NBRC 101105]|uniref:hypothetical protein n=1 Tax=Herbidospora sp. NBRC 101105 TaxID=3032195 RepID=UPI0024A5D2E7|nr:hypothetical protein [Herbidospora sp. NBRC 101105]GLX95265.1 hypothetical protein Hesp01_32150 [Herbidospora sp. NBRC 101105]